MTTYSILFVCMGNICRSPTAHGVFRQMVIDQGLSAWVKFDSAGTHNYHRGSPPDERSQALEECPQAHQHKVRRLTEFCLQHNSIVVPDPYYGGKTGFEHVLDLVEDACEGLILHIKKQRGLTGMALWRGRRSTPDSSHWMTAISRVR